jgi:hypothetical protein
VNTGVWRCHFRAGGTRFFDVIWDSGGSNGIYKDSRYTSMEIVEV